jgi:pimeloyl-ACP methyl ester carboxylesterase
MADRTLPKEPPAGAETGWLDDVPAELHDHLDQAVGNRTREVAGRVAALIGASRTDEHYLDQVRETAYQLSDEREQHVYAGPVLMVCGRADRVAGYADQFAAMTAYPDGTYVALPGAGHYLPYERPAAFAAVVGGWLGTST